MGCPLRGGQVFKRGLVRRKAELHLPCLLTHIKEKGPSELLKSKSKWLEITGRLFHSQYSKSNFPSSEVKKVKVLL